MLKLQLCIKLHIKLELHDLLIKQVYHLRNDLAFKHGILNLIHGKIILKINQLLMNKMLDDHFLSRLLI